MNKIIHSIPNTITCCNLLSGCMAVICSFHGYEPAAFGLNGFQLAWVFIAAATLFDFCDGLSARLLHAYSMMGKELDSLADLVSFGLAPGLVMYNLLLQMTDSSVLPLVALFIPVMGALRLAKFNIDDRQTTTFRGLPIPSNAIFWIGYSAWLLGSDTPAVDGQLQGVWLWLTIILIFAIALLMVSDMKMFSLKFKSMRPQVNIMRYTLLLATIVMVCFLGVQAFMLAIVLYLILSLLDRKRL